MHICTYVLYRLHMLWWWLSSVQIFTKFKIITGYRNCQMYGKLNIVIDSMHMKGHTDHWCKQNCDPKWFPQLNNVSNKPLTCLHSYLCICTYIQVNTEVCEQTFSWLSRYRHIARHMNRTNFMFFVLYICDLHNLREIEKLKNANFLWSCNWEIKNMHYIHTVSLQ